MQFYLSIGILLLFIKISVTSDCEICDLEEDLYKVNKELQDCQSKLNDNSYLGQVCSRVGNWFSKDTSLKVTVANLLSKLEIKESSDVKNVEKEIVIKLSVDDIECLRKFVTEDESNSKHVEDILIKSITVKETLLDKTSEFLSSTITETSLHFKANYVIIFQVLVLVCCVILPLALGAPKLPVFLLMCLYTVLTTWVKMYYIAAAKKQATLAKHAQVPYTCHISNQGWMAAMGDFISGLFNGKQDPCEAYYTAAMVDPALEVGLVAAVMETFSSCIVIPAQTLGLALGSYYHSLLEPLPWVWKAPVLILATILLLFLLLLVCGYEFSIPFLLRIGPGQKRKRKQSDNQIIDHDQALEDERNTRHRVSNGSSGGWQQHIFYDRHPSEECDMTDKGKMLPYPTERNEIDKIVDGN